MLTCAQSRSANYGALIFGLFGLLCRVNLVSAGCQHLITVISSKSNYSAGDSGLAVLYLLYFSLLNNKSETNVFLLHITISRRVTKQF